MAAYGRIPQSRVSPYEPYSPGEDFGAWRRRNPLRVATSKRPMSMFSPQTPTAIRPRYDPNRIIKPADMQFRPRTPTRIFEPQTPTEIEPSPFEPRVPTQIETPFEPQEATLREPPLEPKVATLRKRLFEPQEATLREPPGPEQPATIPDVILLPGHGGLVRVAVGISSPGSRFRRLAPYSLKNFVSRPGILDYMINTYGNQTVRLILLKAGLDPEEYFGAEGE